MLRFQPAWLLLLSLCASGCDNVGRAWDPVLDPGEPDPVDTFSAIQIVPTGGDARDGRPKVKATFPSEGGWPLRVPIVVEFSESINEASVKPTTPTGTDGRVIVRVRGTTQPIPCQYDFLGGGRLLVMRPLAELSNAQLPTYEVLLLPDARDVDGVRFQVETGGKVLSEFQVNQDEQFTDGRILTTFPRDNASGVPRETDYLVIFDRPANATSIESSNVFLRPAGGTSITGDPEIPLLILNLPDPRVVLVKPNAPLAASGRFELVVDETITFGQDGVLDFRGRTPFARFDTTAPAVPTGVELGNPSPGFPNKINRSNLANAILRVTTPADAEIGDRVRARIYGGDADTTATADLTFVESTADLVQAGSHPVDLDLSGALGSLDQPKFDDGSITFAAQMQRGSESSGFVKNPQSAQPRFDLTPPTLTQAGPPSGGNATDILTDLESVAFYGTASEDIAEATLADGVNPPASLFASDSAGHFLMKPLALGRLTAPRGYSLTLTDRAGNLALAAATGNIVQRGIITGLVAGTLTIEAYDQATLLPIAGATVLVDPGAPTVPASGQQQVGTTDSTGRAPFTVSGSEHTVTIVRAGYNLVTLYRTGSAFVSLPLRPTATAEATATLGGAVAFQAAPQTTAVVGSSALDSRSPIGVRTTNAAPNEIPGTPIVPNRPQVVTAFAGQIEPTGAPPAFSFQGAQMLGATLQVPTPPTAPAAAGAASQQAVSLVPNITGLSAPIASYQKDFGVAVGLDTGNLVGGKPVVRLTMSLQGFEGQVLAGLGSATVPVVASFTVNADLGLPIALGFAPFGPLGWVVAEARDTGDRISRHRALLDLPTGQPTAILDAPSIPVVTAPGGPITGSPAVTFADVLFAAPVPGGQGIVELTARDSAGRTWVILFVDRDVAGGDDTLQYPDLAAASVAGLQAGAWNVQAEARLLISLTLSSSDDLVLTERVRQEILYSRSATQLFTIQ